MKMASKRRYKITDKTKAYHYAFDFFRTHSEILSGGGEKPNVHSLCLTDINTLLGLRMELAGARKNDTSDPRRINHYRNPDTNVWHKAKLINIREEMQELEKKWEKYQKQKMNEGRAKPETRPKEMQEKVYELEAQLDVTEEELEEVEKRLAAIQKVTDVAQEKRVLKHGVHGSAKLIDGKIVELDGQKVSKDPKTEQFYIDEEKSPYDGMSTVDYFQMHQQAIAYRNERLKKIKAAIKSGKRKSKRLPKFYGYRPEWPKGAKNYKQEKK